MSTIKYCLQYKLRSFIKKYKKPKLSLSPQKKTTVMRVRICTPRKPNSAKRPVIKGLVSNKKKVLAHIPGIGHTLKKHSRVLINGNGLRDVPVVNYSCIRGVFDFTGLHLKKRRRSVYGAKLSIPRTHIKRKLRVIS